MWRLISLLFVVLVLVTIVACDQEPTATPEPATETPATPASEAETTAADQPPTAEDAPVGEPAPTDSPPVPTPTEKPLESETPVVLEDPQISEEEGLTVDEMVAELDGLTIDDFFDRSFELILLRRPQWITELGIEEYFGIRNDRLDNLSDAYIHETFALKGAILDRLRQYDRASLTPEQQISYDIYQWWLQQEVAGHTFMYNDYPVHHFLNGYQDNLFLLFTDSHPLNSREDAEDYIARLSQLDEQIAQVIEGLEIRTEMGIIPPDFILRMTRERMIRDLGQSTFDPDLLRPGNIALYTTFRSKIKDIEGLTGDEQKALAEAAALEIEQSFFPAYLALLAYLDSLADEATPVSGVWRLPEGEAYYNYLLADSTSTDMTPVEVHELGLREVERIQVALNELLAELGYETDEPLEALMYRAIDEGGFVSGSTQILDAYYELIAGVEARMDAMFDIGPEAELIVVGDQRGGGGYYWPATIDGERPGAFHAGISGQIPKYFMPTVTYHEGIPGHHFQIALAQEMDLPLFRNVLQYNGFGEGWALYAERLAKEMGLYENNPYGDVGRLELELLRAVRLVADTGIHSLGWTRQQARDYMIEAMGGAGWAHEIERYVVLPGQATGYMVGMLTILDQRQRAQEALGEKFDIIEFHRVVLENGSLPLDILEEVVDQWIASVQEAA